MQTTAERAAEIRKNPSLLIGRLPLDRLQTRHAIEGIHAMADDELVALCYRLETAVNDLSDAVAELNAALDAENA